MQLYFLNKIHVAFKTYFVFTFFKKIYLLYVAEDSFCLHTLQKRESDLVSDGCEPPCGCWDLKSGPSEEQSMLLTAEPSLYFLFLVFYRFIMYTAFCLHACLLTRRGRQITIDEPPCGCWELTYGTAATRALKHGAISPEPLLLF